MTNSTILTHFIQFSYGNNSCLSESGCVPYTQIRGLLPKKPFEQDLLFLKSLFSTTRVTSALKETPTTEEDVTQFTKLSHDFSITA